jgi:hypothetical protein
VKARNSNGNLCPRPRKWKFRPDRKEQVIAALWLQKINYMYHSFQPYIIHNFFGHIL